MDFIPFRPFLGGMDGNTGAGGSSGAIQLGSRFGWMFKFLT